MAEDQDLDGVAGGNRGDPAAPKDPVEELADHLLLSMLAARRLLVSERTARVEAGLLRVLIAEGAAEEVAGFMAPHPAGTASFEVVVDDPRGGGRSVNRFGPDVEAAVRDALRAAGQGAGVGLVAIDGSVRRLVMRSSLTRRGSLELLAPEDPNFEGDTTACRAAIEAWRSFVAAAPDTLSSDGGPGRDRGRPAVPDAALADAVREAVGQIDIEIDTESVRTAIRETLADADMELDLSVVQSAVRSALNDLTVSIDLTDLEETLERVVNRTVGTDPGGEEGDGSGPSRRVALLSDIEAVVAESRDGIGEVLARAMADVSESMSQNVSEAVSKAVAEWLPGTDLVRRGDLAPLATTADLSELARTSDLGEVARRSELLALTERLGSPEPTPPVAASPATMRLAEEISRAVVAQLEPLLSSSRPRSGAEAGEAIVGAAEQLGLQMQSFDERVTAGARSLEVLAEELASRDRAAGELTDQLARTTSDHLEQLAQKIGARLDDLGQRVDQEAVAAELRSLNRRMDRILQVIDEVEGPPDEPYDRA